VASKRNINTGSHLPLPLRRLCRLRLLHFLRRLATEHFLDIFWTEEALSKPKSTAGSSCFLLLASSFISVLLSITSIFYFLLFSCILLRISPTNMTAIGDVLHCPLCETKTHLSSGKTLQKNVLAEYFRQKVLHESVEGFCGSKSLLHLYSDLSKIRRKKKKKKIDNCEKGVSEWYCNTCSSSMCVVCFKQVHSAPLFRKHHVVPFGEREMNTVMCSLALSIFL